jgi:hypothetical protein
VIVVMVKGVPAVCGDEIAEIANLDNGPTPVATVNTPVEAKWVLS